MNTHEIQICEKQADDMTVEVSGKGITEKFKNVDLIKVDVKNRAVLLYISHGNFSYSLRYIEKLSLIFQDEKAKTTAEIEKEGNNG